MNNLAKAVCLCALTSSIAFGQQTTSCSDLMKFRIPGVAIEFTKAEKIWPELQPRDSEALPLCRFRHIAEWMA